jgi:SAM-dependent methyltransferase
MIAVRGNSESDMVESGPADSQCRYWDDTYRAHPQMYGDQPSSAAVYAAGVFKRAGATDILELGAGHGRDAVYFASEGFNVWATDVSSAGIGQLQATAHKYGVADRVSTIIHDIRDPLPLPDSAVDAVYAHMLLCMALSTSEIHAAVDQIRRVLRPRGALIYTVRHTGDAHYRAGIAHGDDIFEHGGFAVHFFTRRLVDDLADGWTLHDVHEFEEGALPRHLWRVMQSLPQTTPLKALEMG